MPEKLPVWSRTIPPSAGPSAAEVEMKRQWLLHLHSPSPRPVLLHTYKCSNAIDGHENVDHNAALLEAAEYPLCAARSYQVFVKHATPISRATERNPGQEQT